MSGTSCAQPGVCARARWHTPQAAPVSIRRRQGQVEPNEPSTVSRSSSPTLPEGAIESVTGVSITETSPDASGGEGEEG